MYQNIATVSKLTSHMNRLHLYLNGFLHWENCLLISIDFLIFVVMTHSPHTFSENSLDSSNTLKIKLWTHKWESMVRSISAMWVFPFKFLFKVVKQIVKVINNKSWSRSVLQLKFQFRTWTSVFVGILALFRLKSHLSKMSFLVRMQC